MDIEQVEQSFTDRDIAAATAIVSVFESSHARPKYDALAILHDGPGEISQVTHGYFQGTDASNSLDKIVREFVEAVPAMFPQDDKPALTALQAKLGAYLSILAQNTTKSIVSLARDTHFHDLLKQSAGFAAGRDAQRRVFRANYVEPAIRICAGSGFVEPLSLAVILDSLNQGGFRMVRDRVPPRLKERDWIANYCRTRANWLRSNARQAVRPTFVRGAALLGLAGESFRDPAKPRGEGNWPLAAPIVLVMGGARGQATITQEDLDSYAA